MNKRTCKKRVFTSAKAMLAFSGVAGSTELDTEKRPGAPLLSAAQS
jgi:hypothetical protein